MRCRQVDRSDISIFFANFFAAEILAWRGEQPLWKVFWIYGVAASVAIAAVYADTFYNDWMAFRQALLFCFAAYTAWLLVAVWRCAGNSEETLWGILARFLTVAWAANTILVLTFLEIGVIANIIHR